VGKRWHKSIPTDARSFHRTKGTKRPEKAVLIATEGVNTEPVYFEELKKRLKLSLVEVAVEGAGRGDPRKLAEMALAIRRARRKAAKAGTLAFSAAADFDEVWIVFDTDVLSPEKYLEGVRFAREQGIRLAESTPCFEYWLLLHLENTAASMPKFKDLKLRLEAKLRCSYAKDTKEAEKLIPPMLDWLSEAMSRAKQVRMNHQAAGTPAPANPSTSVDLLIESIQAMESEANEEPG
jgi:RloB-like protein